MSFSPDSQNKIAFCGI